MTRYHSRSIALRPLGGALVNRECDLGRRLSRSRCLARQQVLDSLSAMTTYGHSNRYLKDQWQLMGALEALNGMLLFELTTAFLFAMIQRVWPLGSRERHRKP